MNPHAWYKMMSKDMLILRQDYSHMNHLSKGFNPPEQCTKSCGANTTIPHEKSIDSLVT